MGWYPRSQVRILLRPFLCVAVVLDEESGSVQMEGFLLISKTWDDFTNGLGGRAKSFLRRHNLNSFSALAEISLDEMVGMSGCGTSTSNEICFRMNLFGYEMKPNQREIEHPTPVSTNTRQEPSADDVAVRQSELRDCLKALTFKLPLRDLCAFQAMSAIIGNDPDEELTFKQVADIAYSYSDAMMDRRDRKPEGV